MTNSRIVFLVIVLLTNQLPNRISAVNSVDSGITVANAERVIEHGIFQRYDIALALIDSLNELDTVNPLGSLLKATILASRTNDYEDNQDIHGILTACETTDSLVELYWDDKEETARYWFYRGMSQLYRAFAAYRTKSWYSSLRHTLDGKKKLTRACNMDSTLWNVYFGLGICEYNISNSAGILRRIGLVADRRNIGLQHLNIAAERGTFTRVAARNSLAWIALDNEDLETAVRLSEELIAEYNGVRAFHWVLGKAMISAKKWSEAVPVYEYLLSSVRSESRNNHFNEIDCLHKLTVIHTELHDWVKVIEYGSQVDELELSDDVRKRKRKNLKEIRELVEEARERSHG